MEAEKKGVTALTVELGILISIVSVAIGVLGTSATMKRNRTIDDKKEASEMTTVIVKLENIGDGVTEIKNDMRNIRNDVQNLHERVVAVEASYKSLHKRVDRMEGLADRERE